jgi:hypothetical protein
MLSRLSHECERNLFGIGSELLPPRNCVVLAADGCKLAGLYLCSRPGFRKSRAAKLIATGITYKLLLPFNTDSILEAVVDRSIEVHTTN